jgi:hypothetical protein
MECAICKENKPADQYTAKQGRRSADKRKCAACISSYTGPSYWAEYHAENPNMKPGSTEASHHAAEQQKTKATGCFGVTKIGVGVNALKV